MDPTRPKKIIKIDGKKSSYAYHYAYGLYVYPYYHTKVDVIGNPNTTRPYTEILDAPNGIRTVWSDSAVVEKNVNIIIDPATALNDDGTTVGYFDSGLTDNWTISADLKPTGFMPSVDIGGGTYQQAWSSGAVIFLYDGCEGPASNTDFIPNTLSPTNSF